MSYQKVYMNQVHSSTLLSQLAQMWKSQLLCDAIIKTGTVTTKAHRLVLVAACPMLQSMENASVGSHLEVRLAAEIKQEAVNTFLQYLYEGFMMLTEENVRDVEKVARLLQVESIITCCSDFDKCLRAKNGSLPPNAPYKYNFADLVEFRHVRTTDLQKTVQERMMKRAAEMARPSSPGNKRQRMHKPSSDSHSDNSYIGANRTDDTLSMTQSYMSGGHGSSGGSQWDRVPRIGSGMPMNRPGRDHMPGVIDIVDDSIELVQTEPPEKGGGKSDPKTVQKSVSVSISSQISTSDVQVVNVTDSDTSSKTSVTPTPSSSSSRGSITVSPLTIFDSPAGRDTSTNRSQESKRDESRQTDTGQSQRADAHPSQKADSHSSQRSDSHPSQRSPFPVALSSAQGSGQSKQFGPSGGQAKPFAAGSATQASFSHSSPISSTPSSSSPASHSMSRNDSLERASPAEKTKSSVKQKEPPESSTADMTPDLSIVKIEARNSEVDTGGLDMYVDMPEQGVMQLHRRNDEDQGEGSDIEYEEPSGDWSREDMSNEGSNISGDQNNSWYVGTFKDWLMSQGHSGSFEDMSTHQLNDLLSGFYSSYANTEECPKILLKWFPLELSRYLNSSPFHRDVDITCGQDFVSSNVALDLLQKDFSVTVPSSFDESHSKPISFPHLRVLYNSASLSNSDPSCLQNKIWTDINLYCGVLSRLVLRALKKSSFVIENDETFARKYYRIVDENVSYEKQVTRIYEQPLSPFCPVRSLELYLSKLNPRSDVFFQQPKKDYSHVQWYLESAIGKNVHSNKLSQICMQAGINIAYRNTALRPISKFVQSQAADYTPEYSDGILRIITGDDDSATDQQFLFQAATYGFVSFKDVKP